MQTGAHQVHRSPPASVLRQAVAALWPLLVRVASLRAFVPLAFVPRAFALPPSARPLCDPRVLALHVWARPGAHVEPRAGCAVPARARATRPAPHQARPDPLRTGRFPFSADAAFPCSQLPEGSD